MVCELEKKRNRLNVSKRVFELSKISTRLVDVVSVVTPELLVNNEWAQNTPESFSCCIFVTLSFEKAAYVTADDTSLLL